MARFWTDEGGPAWVSENDRLDERLVPLTGALVDALDLAAGEKVLDVGCGAGGSSVDFARQVGTDGQVVGTDISETMLGAARARASAADAAPITWLAADAQTHSFGSGAFDAIASRFGVMFFDDPMAAFRNLRGALGDGGRFVFLCWQEPRANPWFFVGVDELRDLIEFPDAPAPHSPGPFGLADASRTHGLLDAAGFGSVEIDAVTVDMPFSGSVDDMVSHLMTIGPVGGALRDGQSEKTETAHERMTEVVAAMAAADGLNNPAAAWLVRALP